MPTALPSEEEVTTPGPLERWARFVVRRHRAVLGCWVLVGVLAVAVFIGLPERLDSELFVDPGAESFQGQELLVDEFGVGVPNFLLLVTGASGTVDDPRVSAEAAALVQRLDSEPGIADVVSYWTSGSPPELRSTDGRRGMVVARIEGDEEEVFHRVGSLRDAFETTSPVLEVRAGGQALALRELGDRSVEDFEAAERLVLPLVLIALLLVFRSAVASMVSLLVAIAAVLATGLVLRVIVAFTPLSIFALTIVATLALGLGVDYSLFLISRFREERVAGWSTEEAVVRSVRTAGRTILFGAVSVMISILALGFMPLKPLRSMGLGCAATAAMAGVAALVLLPAVLAALGPNIDRWSIPARARGRDEEGRWYRITQAVITHRYLVGGLGVLALLLMSAPALRLDPGFVDDRDFPPDADVRQIGDILRDEFDTRVATPISVVLLGPGVQADAASIDSLASTIAALPNVTKVVGASGVHVQGARVPLPDEFAAGFLADGATYLNVYADVEPLSEQSDELLSQLREIPSHAQQVLVTGEAAISRDVVDRIVSATPFIFGAIALATAIALFLQFGSILIPIKALALNLLSLTSLLGVAVWAFQDGHLARLLDFTPTGTTYVTLPVLIFCIGFGLSMDYELFLMSRIKEEYDRTGDSRSAIALGVQRSGRIISAAAVLLSVVFLVMGFTSSATTAKVFGFGLGFLILLDAFVIRCTVAPALMSLAGRANWWAPAPLRRLHTRLGFTEHVQLDVAADDISS